MTLVYSEVSANGDANHAAFLPSDVELGVRPRTSCGRCDRCRSEKQEVPSVPGSVFIETAESDCICETNERIFSPQLLLAPLRQSEVIRVLSVESRSRPTRTTCCSHQRSNCGACDLTKKYAPRHGCLSHQLCDQHPFICPIISDLIRSIQSSPLPLGNPVSKQRHSSVSEIPPLCCLWLPFFTSWLLVHRHVPPR